jgi:transposase
VFEAVAQDLRPFDSRTLRSTPESGPRAGYDGAKRKRGSQPHMAVDTLGHLLVLHVTSANVDYRAGAAVGTLAAAVHQATCESVDLIYVDLGYTGEHAAAAAKAQGAELCVVQLAEPKKGFVLLLKRWVVESSFAWATRCRRLVKDYERYAQTLAGFHVVALACLMLSRAIEFMLQGS